MTALPRVVVDASTAAKWVLEDEEATNGALALLGDFAVHARLTVDAPVLIWYELAHLLVRAERRLRISPEQVDRAVQYVGELGIALHSPSPAAVIGLARRLRISAYDASYVALAQEDGTTLWTADQRLVGAARSLGFVRWIGDYRSA